MLKKKAKKLLPLYLLLKQLPSKKRTELLQYLDEESAESLYEAVHNILTNPIIGPTQRRRLYRVLKPHKVTLRYLGDKRKSKKQKRQKLAQIGGNPLALILSTAIPILTEILMKKIS